MVGGVKAGNLLRTLFGSVSSTRHILDGVAVVSEIVSSRSPKGATETLAGIIQAFRTEFVAAPVRGWAFPSNLYGQEAASPTTDGILEGVVKLMAKVRDAGPLVHQVCFYLLVDVSYSVIPCGRSPTTLLPHNPLTSLSR